MPTPLTHTEIQTILASHTAWRTTGTGQCANLRGADLQGANLQGADLQGADLRGADLPTRERWETYLTEVVPALCVAGGQPLAVVAAAWECHSWKNCPMAVAFGVHDLDHIPLLYKPRVEQFVQLFDARLLPNPCAAQEGVSS